MHVITGKGTPNGIICREQKERIRCQKRDKYVHSKAEKQMKIYTTVYIYLSFYIPLLHNYTNLNRAPNELARH